MSRQRLLKGNEATVYGALLAGCECFFGYPITPASEIAHAAAELFPKLNRVFLQAESEIAAINMVLGAAAAGRRAMTASSGLGISLKQEGVSYLAASELPAVIIDITRGGPGLGNIGPEQSDYNQVVKGGGHGNYRCLVLAPNSAQEMCDLTVLAFDLAERYLTPVYVLADGVIGQMLESVTLPEPLPRHPTPPWALAATPATRNNYITSIYLDHDDLEQLNRKLQDKYQDMRESEQRCETYRTEDADLIITGYGIISRLIHSAVDDLRACGIRAGMIRPITLFPFPEKAFQAAARTARAFLCVEMSNGQMVDDVRLAISCSRPVRFYGRMGGNVPEIPEILAEAEAALAAAGGTP
jgi:pyruvate/2-oxoacid:ferredoxin oxidoreductase alpha subunit